MPFLFSDTDNGVEDEVTVVGHKTPGHHNKLPADTHSVAYKSVHTSAIDAAHI